MALELAPTANRKLLVIDPSGSHLAYCLVSIEGETLTFEHIGMLWTGSTWELGQRLDYMYRGIKTLLNYKHFISDSVYTEAFFVNRAKMMGISVIPTINNLMQMLIFQIDSRIGFKEIGPPTWRSILGIKPLVTDGKRDYKTPTADMVKRLTKAKLPDEVISNVTGKSRALPNDVTDCMAIALSIGKTLKCTKFEVNSFAFNDPTLLNEIRGLNEKST